MVLVLRMIKAIGGGVTAKILYILCSDIFCTPGFGGPGTFYRIKKYCAVSEIWASEDGTFSVILPKIGPIWGKIGIFRNSVF